LAKMTSKNQITIPSEVAKKFRGTWFDVRSEGDTITLIPISSKHADDVRKKLEEMGITEETVEDAVKWARRQQGHARFLVSGDKDLLDYAEKVDFKIIRPADFAVTMATQD